MMKEKIFVGDYIRYKPTGTILRVKEIYADNCEGIFNLAGGKMKQARAVLIVEGDSGHYPVGDNIERIERLGIRDEQGGEKMRAVICPVCNGTGKVSVKEPTMAGAMETCHGCGGKGWVEIHDDWYPQPYFYPRPYRDPWDLELGRQATTTTNGRHSVGYKSC